MVDVFLFLMSLAVICSSGYLTYLFYRGEDND